MSMIVCFVQYNTFCAVNSRLFFVNLFMSLIVIVFEYFIMLHVFVYTFISSDSFNLLIITIRCDKCYAHTVEAQVVDKMLYI